MSTRLSIGDFALVTRLTITTLRHYHRIGLLEPADVDPSTNYRYYTLDQVPTALTIRRYRQLQIPVEDVGALLATADGATRDRLLHEHLGRMHAQLQATQDAVSALRALLTQPRSEVEIVRRRLEPSHAIAESSIVDHDSLVSWWTGAIARLREQRSGLGEGDPVLGGLFDHDLFTHGRGRATVFKPVAEPRPGSVVVPGGTFAAAVHHGPHATIDLTYAALGTHLTERAEVGTAPVLERYLVSGLDTPDRAQWQTEICLPVHEQATTPGS
ncbi:MAG: MerR family transcriptional regulator [Actinomycetota bacterium]|jgi:DNA-binding transcriptional MerR regulator|nr:MerR family transcriptional regulator [Actinomycetota bacterium]